MGHAGVLRTWDTHLLLRVKNSREEDLAIQGKGVDPRVGRLYDLGTT